MKLEEISTKLSVNVETINHIQTELSRIADKVDNTEHTADNMAICFYDIKHKILILHELLNHVTDKMNDNMNELEQYREEVAHEVE